MPGVRTARLLAAVMRGLRRRRIFWAGRGGAHHGRLTPGAWSCGAVPETTAPRSPSGVVIASPCRPGSASGSLPALSVRRGVGVMQAHPPSELESGGSVFGVRGEPVLGARYAQSAPFWLAAGVARWLSKGARAEPPRTPATRLTASARQVFLRAVDLEYQLSPQPYSTVRTVQLYSY